MSIKSLSLLCAAAMLSIAVTSCKNNDQSSSTETTTTTDSVNAMNAAANGTNAASTTADSMNMAKDNSAAANTGMSDQEFVTKASSMNLAEINAHKAAGTHAVTADVKMHAKHMLTDHSKMGDDMKALAAKKNMTVSTEPPADKKQMLDDMNASKKGKDWDMAYIDAQVNDHNEAIALFESGSKSVKDADLKALIDKSLPTLRDHLKMVQDVQSKMSAMK